MYCTKCGKEINEKLGVCDVCENSNVNVKKKKMPTWAIILIVICILFLFFIFAGDDGVAPKYDSNGNPVYVENSQLEYIYTDTAKYYGQFVELGGVVFGEPSSDGKNTIIQIWADPENAKKNTMIYYEGSIDVKAEDYIKISGFVYDVMNYTNAFGGSLSAPVIKAEKIEKSTYLDVVSPTLKEVTYNDKVINQNEYILEVNKVQFAEKETRVYVTAKNDAQADFSLYTYGAVIVQNGKQYEQQTNFYADYEKLQSDLKVGVSSSGVLIFPKLEQTSFDLILDGSSDDWKVNIDEYKFNLDIK